MRNKNKVRMIINNVEFQSVKHEVLEDDAEMIIYFWGNTPNSESNAYYTIYYNHLNTKKEKIQEKVSLNPTCSSYQAQFWGLVYSLHHVVANLGHKISKNKVIIIRGNMLSVIKIMSNLSNAKITENVCAEAFKWIKYLPKVQFQMISRDKVIQNINRTKTAVEYIGINLTLSLNNSNEHTMISYISRNSNDNKNPDTASVTHNDVKPLVLSDKTNIVQNFKCNIEKSYNGVVIKLNMNQIDCKVNEKKIIRGSMISFNEITTSISFDGISLDKGDLKEWKIILDNIVENEVIILKPRIEITFTLEFLATYTQKLEHVISFNFKNNNNNNKFSIKKFIFTTCRSNDLIIEEMLSSINPYQKKKRNYSKTNEKNIIRGIPLKQPNMNSNYIPLPKYSIPKSILDESSNTTNNSNLNIKYEQIFLINDSEDNNNNMVDYIEYYHVLLWLEELQHQRDMFQFNIDNTILTYIKHTNYLSLIYEGLAEKRPSILKGDVLYVDYKNKKYEGYIHKIEKNRIFLRFNEKFHSSYIQNDKCNVEFRYSRTLFRIYHQSLDQIKLNPSIFNFINPKQPQIISTITTTNNNNNTFNNTNNNKFRSIRKFNKDLNDIQMFAINNILYNIDNSIQPSPYIIFGPPGTGKTSTMVEAIKQIGTLYMNSKILICAPSNTAANLLLQKLSSTINPNEMFRFMSYNIQESDLNDSKQLLKYCLFDKNENGFIFPDINIFKSYKYIVCTCSMAGKLSNYGIDINHFNAIFIDESCYAFEPEIIGCFSSLLNNNHHHSTTTTNTTTTNTINNKKLLSNQLYTGQLILAGDPKQLGPIIRSTYCNDLGGKLTISLLERLTTMNPLYKCDLNKYHDTVGYNPKYITMLLNCYRCHKNILHISNELFYNNKLKCSIEFEDVLVNWNVLPKKGFPLLFHGVVGEHQREDTNPSWFNIQEIEMIWYYINELIITKKAKPNEIAIITPYYKQMKKLYELIKKKDKEIEYKDLLIGSCEIMQGKEKRIVIVSTVRSSLEYLDKDIYYNLGFLSNPKRFNVAITRAKSLLIIIGNPNVLIKDKNWGNLLHYIKENGNCIGSPLTCNYIYDNKTQTCIINDPFQNSYDNMMKMKDNNDCDYEINNNNEFKSGEDS